MSIGAPASVSSSSSIFSSNHITKSNKVLNHELIDLTLDSSAGEDDSKPGRQPSIQRKRKREVDSEDEERSRKSKKRVVEEMTFFTVAERKFAKLPDDVNEQQLQEHVISSMERQHWHLKAREYDLVPGNGSYGKGDLLFQNEQVSDMYIYRGNVIPICSDNVTAIRSGSVIYI